MSGETIDRVNLQELADLIGVSTNTLATRIRQCPDFPVLSRGSNGVAYEFDPIAAVGWWKADQARDEEAAAARRRGLNKLQEDMFGRQADEPPAAKGPTPQERKTLIEAQLAADKLRRLRGELVERAPLESALASAMVELRTKLLNLPAEFSRREGLSREQRVKLEEMVERTLNGLAADLSRAAFYASDSEAAA